jgi:outer membrane protein assembly factor BamE (lipoprotein component of BamABCDE complex)
MGHQQMGGVMRAIRRRGLPILLICIGLFGLSGCLYIPWIKTRESPEERDLRTVVGDAKSNRPLRVGITDREQVLRLLGEPTAASPDGRILAFVQRFDVGVYFVPVCLSVDRAKTQFVLRLDFDAEGRLVRYSTMEQPVWFNFWLGRTDYSNPTVNAHLHDIRTGAAQPVR